MKFYILFFLILFLPSTILAKDFRPDVTEQVEKEGHWEDVTFKNDNTTVMEFRVWYRYSAEKIFPILIDNTLQAKIHKGLIDARSLSQDVFNQVTQQCPKTNEDLLKVLGETRVKTEMSRDKNGRWTDYIYQNFNFPWPLSDRWLLIKADVDESNAKKGEYNFEYELKCGNFVSLKGWWALKPVPGHEGWTEWYGSYASDAGVALPKVVTKLGVKTGFKNEISESTQYFLKTLGEPTK